MLLYSAMTMRALIDRLMANDRLNFALSNRIPRVLATRAMGWFSRIEQPLVRDLSLAVWKRCADLRLEEARETRFRSLHDCFTRALRHGARPFDPHPAVLASPCDAIVGACGSIESGTLLQAKGSRYRLAELLCDADLAQDLDGGCYATLRITSSMYHRFHAPCDARVERIDYVAGDVWNVNPPALARIERLFCRNERAVVRMRAGTGADRLVLVPVAAVLVASIRFSFVDVRLHLRHRGPNVIACDARVAKGDEMGWFEHGSTLIVLVPPGFDLAVSVRQGEVIRAGMPLMRRRGA